MGWHPVPGDFERLLILFQCRTKKPSKVLETFPVLLGKLVQVRQGQCFSFYIHPPNICNFSDYSLCAFFIFSKQYYSDPLILFFKRFLNCKQAGCRSISSIYFFFFLYLIANSYISISWCPLTLKLRYWENKAVKSWYEKELPQCSTEKKTSFALHMPHKVLQLQGSWSGSGIYRDNMKFRLYSWKGLK